MENEAPDIRSILLAVLLATLGILTWLITLPAAIFARALAGASDPTEHPVESARQRVPPLRRAVPHRV